MAERGIAEDQLEALLARPAVTVPDTKRLGRRIYSDDVMIAVVAEDTRSVITVGYKGASRNDWRTFAAPQGGAAPVEPVVYGKRRRRVKDKGLPVQKTGVLDGVHPEIAAGVREVLDLYGLDYRAVRVHSPTDVEILLS
jgi:IS4 transposase